MEKCAILACVALSCASTREAGGSADPPASATCPGDAGAGEEAPCETDADCALTRVAPGACCPMLCVPRAVTRKRAAELEAQSATCGGGKPCPQPLCRPASHGVTPQCEARRCVAHREAARPN